MLIESCTRSVLMLHCRLAKQVSVLYEDVLRLLSSDPLRSHFDRSWTAHVQVKATLYEVESQLQMGSQLHKDDEIGAEIARLKVGLNAVTALVPWLAHVLAQTNWKLPQGLAVSQCQGKQGRFLESIKSHYPPGCLLLQEAHRMLLIVKKEAKMCGHELQESMRLTEEVRSQCHTLFHTQATREAWPLPAWQNCNLLRCLHCNACPLA